MPARAWRVAVGEAALATVLVVALGLIIPGQWGFLPLSPHVVMPPHVAIGSENIVATVTQQPGMSYHWQISGATMVSAACWPTRSSSAIAVSGSSTPSQAAKLLRSQRLACLVPEFL